jgi:dynein heavy chain
MSWLLNTLVGVGHPCLFVGESGTSKSVTIASYLSRLGSSHITLNMNFSSRTSSLDVQHAIEDSIEKRTKVGVRVPTVQTATAPSWLV